MISVEEAVSAVTAGFSVLPSEQVGIGQALGRVLAEDIASRVSQPPVAVSSMDGYAMRSGDVVDTPTELRIVGELAAGCGFEGVIGPNECVRISTGAPLPLEADAVVIQEHTERHDDRLTVLRVPTPPGRWIRRAGLDFASGETLLSAGTVLTARDIGLTAAMNVPWLKVRRKPRVALVATGDEIVMPGNALGAHQIVSSNSLAVASYITVLGGIPIDLGIAGDDEASLRAILEGSYGSDLLITIGGASVGDHDLVRKVLGRKGFDLAFYRVAMRPGKPLLHGRLGDVPVLGLPGNHVSVAVTTAVFLKPAMEIMLGVREEGRQRLSTAVLGRTVPANDERQDYLRARLTRDEAGAFVATPFDQQDSSMLALLAEADCLVVRPPYALQAAAGEHVPILLWTHGLISF